MDICIHVQCLPEPHNPSFIFLCYIHLPGTKSQTYFHTFWMFVLCVTLLIKVLVFTEEEEAKEERCGFPQSLQPGHQCKCEDVFVQLL